MRRRRKLIIGKVITDGQQLPSSRLASLLAWLKDPRILAVLGALTLRGLDRLSEEITGTVLVIAVGGKATRWTAATVGRLVQKIKGK